MGSHLSAREDVACQLDLGEVSLADGLEQPIVADVRLLVGTRGDRVPAAGARAPGSRGHLIAPISVRGVLWTEDKSLRGHLKLRVKGHRLEGTLILRRQAAAKQLRTSTQSKAKS